MLNLEFKPVILEWFQTVKACGLILPYGWFGRPYDNLHRLSFIEVRPHKLLLELDHQLWLIFTDVSKVYTDNSGLILEDFAQCVFDWQAYGSLSPHVEVFKSGVVKLVPPSGV